VNSRHFANQIWVVAVLLALFTSGGTSWGLRINTTSSVPIGLWHLNQGGTVERNHVVSVCPDRSPLFQMAQVRGYLHAGDCPGNLSPLFKPVAAVPGDTVTVDHTGILVNGKRLPNSQALWSDAADRPMPRLRHGRYKVHPGTVWLVSTKNNSFDSRYFGPISIGQIQGALTPLWVEGDL
jgi:conjugative transfer signal peptidase TraF